MTGCCSSADVEGGHIRQAEGHVRKRLEGRSRYWRGGTWGFETDPGSRQHSEKDRGRGRGTRTCEARRLSRGASLVHSRDGRSPGGNAIAASFTPHSASLARFRSPWPADARQAAPAPITGEGRSRCPRALVKAPSCVGSFAWTDLFAIAAVGASPPAASPTAPAGFTIDSPMVSARMAAVLAVALLLLCGNVQSAEEGAAAYVTQVKISSVTAPAAAPTLATSITNRTEGSDTTHSVVLSTVEQGPAASPVIAPAITTTTEGSDTTHSAVLSAVEQGQDTDLVLVDLARADDEKFINVASAPEPSPSANSIPPGFDMMEAEAPAQYIFTEETAPEPAAAGSHSGTPFAADSSEQGQLLTGNYPSIDEKDHSGGAGYGVPSYGGDGADAQSFAATDEDNASAMTEDEAKSENNGSNTTGFALRKSQTYTRGPNSRQTWGKGKCTFYGGMDASGTMSGACGYGNLYASGYGAYSAALSSALFKNGMACGACYEVACSGAKSCKPGSVLVSVTNFCPPNPGRSADNGGWCNGANQHFDLSYPAFAKIADPKAGVVPLNYRRVPCKKQGGIRFTLNGNCNFNLLTITNVGGSGVVTEVYLKGDNMDWVPMSRNWGANWQCSRNYCGKGISVKVVTSDKKVSVSRLAGPEWAFGKTYIGQQVY